jgi:hypothetical protein
VQSFPSCPSRRLGMRNSRRLHRSNTRGSRSALHRSARCPGARRQQRPPAKGRACPMFPAGQDQSGRQTACARGRTASVLCHRETAHNEESNLRDARSSMLSETTPMSASSQLKGFVCCAKSTAVAPGRTCGQLGMASTISVFVSGRGVPPAYDTRIRPASTSGMKTMLPSSPQLPPEAKPRHTTSS